jgi:hypothetical protein
MRHVGGGVGAHISGTYSWCSSMDRQMSCPQKRQYVETAPCAGTVVPAGTCRDGLGDFAALLSQATNEEMNADSHTLR